MTTVYRQLCNFSNTVQGSTTWSSTWHGSSRALHCCMWPLCFLRNFLCFTIWNGTSVSDIKTHQ